MKLNRYLILDRDGVINLDSPDYIKNPEEFLPMARSLSAIALLTKLGYGILIATNQSGLARGYYSHDILEQIHEKMHALIQAAGGKILDVFFCPHGPADLCLCRKPKIGLYHAIQQKYPDIILPHTYSVGDSLRDLQAAEKAGCLPVLVKTGNGEKTRQTIQNDTALSAFLSVPVFEHLGSFAEFLSSHERK